MFYFQLHIYTFKYKGNDKKYQGVKVDENGPYTPISLALTLAYQVPVARPDTLSDVVLNVPLCVASGD